MRVQAMSVTRREFLKGAAAAMLASSAGRIDGADLLSGGDEAFRREALHWRPLENARVQCTLCPRQCGVEDGDRGYCGVRENRGGKYYTLVYGRAVSRHIDPIEKKPLYHFHPGAKAYSIATAGCNLKCKFCQNWTISQLPPEEVRAQRLDPQAVVADAKRQGAPVIAFTYNEPTIFYEYALETARAGRLAGLKSVMISNGYINPEPLKQLVPELGAYKVDL